MFTPNRKVTASSVRKKNPHSLLMVILTTVVLVLLIANFYQYLRTGIVTKPSALQPDGIRAQVTAAVATPDKEAVSLADSPANKNEAIPPTSISGPVKTVYDFYRTLQNKECDKAPQIWLGYKGCKSIDHVNHVQVDLLQEDANRAAVILDLSVIKNAKVIPFVGYLWLKRGADQHWQIQPDAVEKDKITADQFLSEKAGIMPNTLANTQEKEAGGKIPDTTDDVLQPLLPSTPSSGGQIDVTTIRSFGSQKILNACWTPEALRGGPADKKIMPNKDNPDYSPPERKLPHYRPKPLAADLQGSIRTVQIPDTNKKLVALTFDLCERTSEVAGYDYAIVNYLRDNNIPATFYAGGKWMRSHPDQTKQLMADPLFEIGNHAWTHGNMRVLTGQEMKEQVLWTQAQYELIREDLEKELPDRCPGVPASEMARIPLIPLSFRYPYGTCSNESLNFMGNYGLPSVQWNIVTADPWRKQTADGIVKTVMQGIRPGSIIIAHANGRGWKTIDALPKFIPELQAQGYKFVTVTQLLAEGRAVEASSCFELRPGDNQHYDKEVGTGTE